VEPIVLLVNVVGWAGMLLLVSAYAFVTTSMVRPTGLAFQLMNIVGGTMLAINSAYYGAWPSVALNVVWVGVGTLGIVRAPRRTRSGRSPRSG
jgi:hypothetical protein